MRRNIWLYRRCLGAQLRATLEYEGDFWIMSVAALITQGMGIVFLWAIFRAIPQINGWRFWDVVLIYSLVALTEGIAVLLAQGAWSMAVTVNLGGLDTILVRPYTPLLQLLSSQIGMNGLGNLALGGSLFIAALLHVGVAWSPGRIATAALVFAFAPLVKIGLNILTNCSAFWLKTPWSMFPFAFHTLGELARYPISIYGVVVRVILSVVLPYAFMSYFPVTAVLALGSTSWLGLLTPVAAVWCLLLGRWAFRRGLLRYESAGT